jgi:hypothetical protein
MTAAGDDGRILGKIVELAFVPISTALVREMTGNSNHHVIRDIGDTLKQGFTALVNDIRLMFKGDPMEMSDDFFELANKGSDWFMVKEARCLDAYALLYFEKLTVFEQKYGPINFDNVGLVRAGV